MSASRPKIHALLLLAIPSIATEVRDAAASTAASTDETFEPHRAHVFEPEPTSPPVVQPPPCPSCSAHESDYDDLEAGWLQVHAMGGWAPLDDHELGIASEEDEPTPIRGHALLLDGTGPLLGGGFRFGYQTDDGVRFGAGFAGHIIEDLHLRGGRLEGGVRATLDDVVALRAELALGKAFDLGPVWPHLDAVVAVNVVTAEVRLEVPGYGFVGQSTYIVPSATVAPRLRSGRGARARRPRPNRPERRGVRRAAPGRRRDRPS